MSGQATVLHADLDAFYASVEQRDAPELRGRPVLVGGGVVLAASYEARARGVRSAMGGRRARALCPDAVVVPPRMAAYTEASRAVFAIFEDSSPLVEGISIDEAFLDARGLEHIKGTPAQMAARLRARVREEVGLPLTVGVAATKFLAKVASGVAKPDGMLVVPAGQELEFLHPLEVERLWGVGPVTSRKLRAAGITRVGQVADLREATLIELLGRGAGRHIHALALGRDPRPVRTGVRRRSMGAQRALRADRATLGELKAFLLGLVDGLARRLRGAGRVCRTVTLRLRFADFTRVTRSRTMAEVSAETHALLSTAQGLLRAAAPLIERRGITLIGVSLSGLTDAGAVQLALPLDGERARTLDRTVDSVRDRYGAAAITRGTLVGRDPGISVPLLPD